MTGPGVILRTLDGRIAVNRANSEGNHNRDYVCNKQHLFTELSGVDCLRKRKGAGVVALPLLQIYINGIVPTCATQ